MAIGMETGFKDQNNNKTMAEKKKRKVTIKTVTRVEGHGRVTVHLDEKGEVEDARFHIPGGRDVGITLAGNAAPHIRSIVPEIYQKQRFVGPNVPAPFVHKDPLLGRGHQTEIR